MLTWSQPLLAPFLLPGCLVLRILIRLQDIKYADVNACLPCAVERRGEGVGLPLPWLMLLQGGRQHGGALHARHEAPAHLRRQEPLSMHRVDFTILL